jgi:omega-6 fatty acid desaturase (delta-12 desaturase)
MTDTLDHRTIKQILSRYQTPIPWRSLMQLATSIIPFVAIWVVMVWSLEVSYALTLVLSVFAAGFAARTFIIFHDCGHGSFFSSQRANDITGIITGLFTFTPYYRWRRDHAVHHATAGDLDRRGTGDVMTLTVDEYLALPTWRRRYYAFFRHPITLFTFGAFLVFTVGHRFSSTVSGRKERLGVWYTNLLLAGIISLLIYLVGWKAFLLIQVPITFISASAGVWLFYVQHNFEGTYWERHSNWDFFKAGLIGSSFYKLPSILQWFTGNIGFHHIHHIGSHIPNYLLEKCYRENPELQVPPMTIRKSLNCLRLRLWDEKERRMVGFNHLAKVAVARESQKLGDQNARNNPYQL